MVKSDESEKAGQNLKLRARPAKLQMERLVDRSHSSIHALLDAGRAGGKAMSLPPSAWTVDEVIGPNVTDKETVLSFARMAADAYVDEPGETDWKKVCLARHTILTECSPLTLLGRLWLQLYRGLWMVT